MGRAGEAGRVAAGGLAQCCVPVPVSPVTLLPLLSVCMLPCLGIFSLDARRSVLLEWFLLDSKIDYCYLSPLVALFV